MEETPISKGLDGERDELGRFKDGWKGGPGRPKKTDYQKAYEDLLLSLVNKEQESIIKAAIAKAKTGDGLSFKELNDRVLGKSKQPIEMSGEMPFTIKIIKDNGKDSETISPAV